MPRSVESYVHRVGRTARAGKEGVATTLVEYHQGKWFWNDVARAEGVGRVGKVARGKVEVGGEGDGEGAERERYEEALRKLGEEARPGRWRRGK